MGTRRVAVAGLRNLGAVEAIPPLREVLENPGSDPSLLGFTVGALGVLGDLTSASRILALLDSRDPFVRRCAAFALGTLEDPRAVDALIRRLRDDDVAYVRAAAARALGSQGDPRAVGPLISELSDSAEGARSDAAWALSKMPDTRSIEPLLALLNDPEEHVAFEAVVALGYVGDTRVIPTLEWIRDHRIADYSPPDTFRRPAAAAIAQIKERAE